MWCDTILEPSPPFHFSTCETDWPPVSNDRQVPQKPTQRRDWSILHKKLLQCIRSSDGPDQWSHWTKQGQTKLLITLPSPWSRVPLHVSRKNRWIAIWPMFVAEYFPQFWGNWKWLSMQSVRVHLHHYILGVEFQPFSDRFTVDLKGQLMRVRKSNNGNWSAWITVVTVMYGLLGYNRMVVVSG